jgi:hypothetical protein
MSKSPSSVCRDVKIILPDGIQQLNLCRLHSLVCHPSAANEIIANLPAMRKGLLEALDLVFIPKQIATQLVLAVALETSMVSKIKYYFQ